MGNSGKRRGHNTQSGALRKVSIYIAQIRIFQDFPPNLAAYHLAVSRDFTHISLHIRVQAPSREQIPSLYRTFVLF